MSYPGCPPGPGRALYPVPGPAAQSKPMQWPGQARPGVGPQCGDASALPVVGAPHDAAWVTWGNRIVIGPNLQSNLSPQVPSEICRIECPSPRAVRVTLQCEGPVTAMVDFLVRCGVGGVELTRTVSLSPPSSVDLEVAGRIVRVEVWLSTPAPADVTTTCVLAPVVPWM